ncbi:MAG: M20/M25/M40 family metallo-hydrolase, partial [Phycisphaerae bacterium]
MIVPAAAFAGSVTAKYRAEDAAGVAAWLDANLPKLMEVYEHLHANPELSLHEKRTAALVADHLSKAGYQVTTGVGGHGVVGVMSNGDGPTVLVRGDMDGLPIVEETGVAYASQVKFTRPDGTKVGVMHACGHDVHTTSLIGAAGALAAMKDRWSGTLVMIAQPAEEVGLGAKAMIDDGLFERFDR